MPIWARQTLVTLLGLEGARAEAEKRARRAVEALGPYAAKAPELSALPASFLLDGQLMLAKCVCARQSVRVPFSFGALTRGHKESLDEAVF